jgi:hypothetical protein
MYLYTVLLRAKKKRVFRLKGKEKGKREGGEGRSPGE